MRQKELLQVIDEKGVENVRFLVPMRPIHDYGFVTFRDSSDKPVMVECKINEERYQLKDHYKITMESLKSEFGKEHFYLSDFVSLMNDGHISLKSE